MDRIKKEEIYRNEVRSNLEKEGKPSTRLEKSWGFVNSPFMLWVLSTVIVGLVSFGYTRYQERMKKEEENRQTAQKLRAEIDNRSKEILRLTAQVIDESRTRYYEPRWIYKTAVNFLDGEKDSSLTAYQICGLWSSSANSLIKLSACSVFLNINAASKSVENRLGMPDM